MALFSRNARKDCRDWTSILKGEDRKRLLERMAKLFSNKSYYARMNDRQLRDEILREYLDSAGHFNHLDD